MKGTHISDYPEVISHPKTVIGIIDNELQLVNDIQLNKTSNNWIPT